MSLAEFISAALGLALNNEIQEEGTYLIVAETETKQGEKQAWRTVLTVSGEDVDPQEIHRRIEQEILKDCPPDTAIKEIAAVKMTPEEIEKRRR